MLNFFEILKSVAKKLCFFDLLSEPFPPQPYNLLLSLLLKLSVLMKLILKTMNITLYFVYKNASNNAL